MTKNKNNKRRGRPPKYDMPERIDASPEEIGALVNSCGNSLPG